jgi:hypothetical protein
MIGYEGERYGVYFWFVGWDCWSLGVSFCWSLPNVELHVPFGFFRIGRLQRFGPGLGWRCELNRNKWQRRNLR